MQLSVQLADIQNGNSLDNQTKASKHSQKSFKDFRRSTQPETLKASSTSRYLDVIDLAPVLCRIEI